MTDYRKLRQLAEAATPGPWSQCTAPDTNNNQAVCDHNFEFIARTDLVSIHSFEICEANASFIAAANPTVVLELLDEIERLRDALNEACDIAERLSRSEHLDHRIAELRKAGR